MSTNSDLCALSPAPAQRLSWRPETPGECPQCCRQGMQGTMALPVPLPPPVGTWDMRVPARPGWRCQRLLSSCAPGLSTRGAALRDLLQPRIPAQAGVPSDPEPPPDPLTSPHRDPRAHRRGIGCEATDPPVEQVWGAMARHPWRLYRDQHPWGPGTHGDQRPSGPCTHGDQTSLGARHLGGPAPMGTNIHDDQAPMGDQASMGTSIHDYQAPMGEQASMRTRHSWGPASTGTSIHGNQHPQGPASTGTNIHADQELVGNRIHGDQHQWGPGTHEEHAPMSTLHP